MTVAFARGGTVLIPAFAIDRTPLLLMALRAIMPSGALPIVPVYVDSPIALAALDIYHLGGRNGDRRTSCAPLVAVEGFSAHADAGDVLAWLCRGAEPRVCYVVHGVEAPARDAGRSHHQRARLVRRRAAPRRTRVCPSTREYPQRLQPVVHIAVARMRTFASTGDGRSAVELPYA